MADMASRLSVENSFPLASPTDEELCQALGLQTPGWLLEKDFELKPPQLLALEFARINPKYILSFDKGMGKTITYMLSAHNSGATKWLIICGKSAMLTQYEHAKRFWPDKKVVFIRGQDWEREKAWNLDADIYCVSGPIFLRDMGCIKLRGGKNTPRIAPPWASIPEYLIWDEYHKMLRNKGSAMHHLMKTLYPKYGMCLSSGSAGGKGPQSLWTVLNILDPKLFSSYWKYVYAYCVVDDTRFGKQITGPKNIEAWRRVIGNYVFHRKKDLKYYPPKTRQALTVEMEPWQQKIHDDMKKNLLAELPSGSLLTAPNVLAATHKIRQLLICPKALDPQLGYGAGLEGILDDAQTAELTHFVISTPYKDPIPYIEEFFQANKYNTYVIKGGTELEDLRKIRDTWTRTGGVVIQTIQFAESYELPAAKIMYMLGYLHDPEQNSQAEDRIHRDIRVTPDPVDIYYVKHKGSYDEAIVEAMSMHADNVHALMNKPIERIFNL